MKKDKNLTEPHNVEKAQENISPELSYTQSELKNGIDIQPLDDITQSEFVNFKYNVVNKNDLDEVSTKTEVKPEKNHSKKYSYIRIAIAVLCLIAAFTGIYLAFFHSDDFTHSAVAVYEQGNQVSVKLENKDIIALSQVDRAILSENGNILAYTQDTDSKTGKYDIRFIDFTKRSSVKNQGSIVVSGIDSDWSMDSSGSYIYYSTEDSGSKKYYAYSTEKNESQLLVANASEIFIPPKGDIVYFTREKSNGVSLHRIRFGEEAQSLTNASNVKAVSNSDTLEIFYTVASEDVNTDTYTLYKISGDKEALKIADNISEVYLDDYQVGGNLYYFIKNDAKLNWNNFVSDPFADTDLNAKYPQERDYMKTIGFFFKRDVLDTVSYNKAIEDYKKAQKRQEIREELNQLDLNLAISSEYKLKVYDTKTTKELTGSVKLDNVLAFSPTGAPRVVYKTSNVKPGKILDINSLYEIALSDGIDACVKYVIDALNDGYEILTSYEYSWYDGNKVLTYNFNPGYDVKKADIKFAGRDRIVASVPVSKTKAKLCFNLVQNKAIGDTVEICDNITDFKVENDRIFYTVPNSELGDLYEYTDVDKSFLLCKNNVNFYITTDGNLVLLQGIYKDSLLDNITIYLRNGKDNKLISENVSLNSFNFANQNNAFSYIKDYRTAAATDTSAIVGGELIIYYDGNNKSVDKNVTSIRCINYSELTK